MKNRFTITLEEKVYKNSQISGELIEDIIHELTKPDATFIVLEPEDPINECTLIQALGGFKDAVFVAEAVFSRPDDTMQIFRIEGISEEECIKMFLDFWQKGIVPETKDWDDVSKKI
ncbi:hypothetical protein [Xylocopilactobacillus apicola]|uniref:Uncharacterized protein n=1 Tax=Xylocopilactobacillus apicola TaxID=2932184 RepID=A0AAU9D3P8_9LACO|nr:hypothetical protein [Xylocopilactobacillus apicola]BDR58078.1 hypothetical protein XA3_05190 [Xylocopilactobacillus apicola]